MFGPSRYSHPFKGREASPDRERTMAEVRNERVEFAGADGVSRLAARLDLPVGTPKAFALFAHCFTCTKNVFAASRIAERLVEHGIAVLRFDFTGLGASEGEFANTNSLPTSAIRSRRPRG